MASEHEVENLVVRLTGENSGYKKTLDESSKATQRFARDVDGKLRDSQGRFLSGSKKLRAELSMANGVLAKSKVLVGSLATSLRGAGTAARTAGKSLSVALTLPAIAAGGVAVKSFASFDQAMTESTSIMAVTAEQTDRMRKAALNLSAGGELQQGPTDLAESYFFLASAGKDAEQSMALLPKVSKFATAGAFDMALATDLLTDAQSALGMTSKDLTQDTENLARVGDVLVKANTLANASVQQFSEAITNRGGAALKSYNKTVEEGVAVLAAYADQGIKGNVAGSNLARVMLLLSKAASDNAKAHKELGFSVFDSTGKMRNMADIIANIEQVTNGMSDELKSVTLTQLGFTAEVQAAILPLLGTSDAIRRYETELRNAKGITEEVADKQMKSFSNQMGILKNQINVAAIEIGETLAPMIGKLSSYLSQGIKYWRQLSPELQRTILLVAAVVAGIGPLLVVLGTLASALGTVLGLLSALLSPIGLITAAVAGLVYVLVDMTVGWDRALQAVKEFATRALGFVMNFRENMGMLTEWMKNNWLNVLKDIVNAFITFHNNMNHNLGVILGTMLEVWWEWAKAVGSAVKWVFSVEFLKWTGEGLKRALELVGEFAGKAADLLKKGLTGQAIGVDTIKNSVKVFEQEVAKQKAEEKPAEDLGEGFLERVGNILKRDAGKLKSPLQGFVAQTEKLPEFNLKVNGVKLEEQLPEELNAIGQMAGQAAGMGIDEGVNKATQEVGRATPEVIQGVAAGSAESLSRIQAYQSGIPELNPRQTQQPSKQEQGEKLWREISSGIQLLVEIGQEQLENFKLDIKPAGL